MEEVNGVPNEGTSSATYSKDKGPLFEGWMGIMTAEEMEVLNDDDNRAFCMAVCSGNVFEARSMLNEKPGLAKIKILNGMLPIHLAASCGHWTLLQDMFYETSLEDLDWEQKVQLFFITLKSSFFGVALDMLGCYPSLVCSRDEEQLTALHLLARKVPDRWSEEDVLTSELWELTRAMERKKMLELISTPSGVLFDAIKSGNFLILEILLKSNPELLMVLDSERRSLLHSAVLYRREMPLYYMIEHGKWKDLVIQVVDNKGNNILHMAAMVPSDERFESSRPDILMQRELLWFKAMEKWVPTSFKSMRNEEKQTPKDIFDNTRRELMIKAKHGMKDKAKYSMLVATIIATIVFAASLTVPGHDVSPEANFSILQKKGWYIVFILSDALALFSSSASIIFFLTVLTSSYTEDEFNTSLLLRMTFGVTALFVAITTMVVAFTSACFLIFNHHSAWATYLVASFGFLTVALFAFLLYTLFRDLIDSLYLSRALRHYLRPVNQKDCGHRRRRQSVLTLVCRSLCKEFWYC